MIKIENINKRFGGLQALSEVNLEVKANTIHGIIGPNGAGKTTLFNIITGMIVPDSGIISVDDRKLPFGVPEALVPMGIARTFQNIRLFPDLPVLENVMIGQHCHTKLDILSIIFNTAKAKENDLQESKVAMEALDFVGLADKKDIIVKYLSYGQQRLVEFARAMATKPKVILLDEPAAGMNPTEKSHLVTLIKGLHQLGYTVVLIEHDMKLVMNLCDKISVLDYGKIIAEGLPIEIRNKPEVINAYLGRRAANC